MAVVTWNEHMFFYLNNKNQAELKRAKVAIRINDHGILKDDLIGYYEFDLDWLYLKPDHGILHKWIIMSDPNGDNFSAVTAYLKCSISVIGEGDKNYSLDADPNPDKEDVL